MIDVHKVRNYCRDMAELRRLAEAGFDRARHREIQRMMLMARERQRHETKHAPIAPGTTNRIIHLTSKVTGISVNEICSERRTRDVTTARWVVAWICRKHTQHSYPAIGRRLGDRDHSTVLHAVKKVQADLDAGGALFGPIIAHVERELGVASNA